MSCFLGAVRIYRSLSMGGRRHGANLTNVILHAECNDRHPKSFPLTARRPALDAVVGLQAFKSWSRRKRGNSVSILKHVHIVMLVVTSTDLERGYGRDRDIPAVHGSCRFQCERSLLEQVVSEVQYFTMAWCAAIDRT
jgi:hypothetical protein